MELKKLIQQKVSGYHAKGLTYQEIGKLMDISPRTAQRYVKAAGGNIQDRDKTKRQRAIELHRKGFSYSEIASRLRVSKTTVYLWHRKEKEQTDKANN